MAWGTWSTVAQLQVGGAGGIRQLRSLGLGREVQRLGGFLRETLRVSNTRGARGTWARAGRRRQGGGKPGRKYGGTKDPHPQGAAGPRGPGRRPVGAVPAGGGGLTRPQASSPLGRGGCAIAAADTPLWKRRQGEKPWMSTEQQTPCLTRPQQRKAGGGSERPSWLPTAASQPECC